MKRPHFKKWVHSIKSLFKKQQPTASAAQETPITANPTADRKSKKRPTISPFGTSTAGDSSHRLSTVSNSTSHEQRTRAQSADPAATAEAPVQPRTNTEIINSDNADGHDADADTAPAKSPPVQPRVVQLSSRAAICDKALETLQKDDPKKYEVLDKVLKNLSTPVNDKVRGMFELSESKPDNITLLLRTKAALPSLGAIQKVVAPFAKVDPHSVAPFVLAGTFFIIDVLLGKLSIEDQRKIRNMLFECVNAINEWISFETNFVKRIPAVEKDVQEVEELLPDLYKLALQLLCNLLIACDASWLKTVGNKLSAKMVEWQEQVEKLKDHRAKWTARRKVMEEALSRQEHIAKVLDWIKKGDDPEQSLRALNDRATSEGRQKDSASWILDNQIFKAWSQNLYPPEPPVSTTSDVVSKRVLWVSGSYGVGKTTIVHRVVSELQKLADGYPPRDDVKGLQVISYFCDTSKRANYETVIRSIGRKLSLLPDFTIARKAQDFYNKHTSGLTATIYIKEYEDLVRDLLNERSKSYNIVLLIDALNECDPFQDAERLCAFISEIVSKNPQVCVLFSSHEQLSGSEQFKEMHLEKMEVVASAPGNALEDFVRTEIKFREDKLKDSRSIFLNSDHKDLLVTLEQSLIDRAKGMYVWVQVWLDITLPLQNSNMIIRRRKYALKLLDELQKTSDRWSKANEQLQAGYQRLWDSGALTRFEEMRICLFRFVLCAFQPLELSTVTHALRIGIPDDEGSYQKDILIEDIDKLCSNFLSKDVHGRLSWTHDSARNFVVRVILDPGIGFEGTSAEETSMKSSHLLVANTFIAVMKDSDHQVWKEADLDPSEWMLPKRESKPDLQKKIDSTRVMMKISNAKSSLGYLGRHGWRHCELAADKHVISDPLWTRVLRELLLHPKTAFALWWQIWFKDPLHPWEPGYRYLEEILGDYAGERVILISHALVFLKLKTDSVWDVQLEKAAKAPLGRSIEEDLAESLVRHAACKNLNGANALHLACEANNGSLLNLMLQAILQRPGGVARVFELLEEEYKSQTPFIWAIKFEVDWAHPQSSYDFDVKGGFLRFENDNPRPNGCDQSSNEAASLCLWSQSCKSWSDFETALMQALYWLEENEVIRLLDIHKPCNIDVQAGNSKRTVLHLAAMDGKIQLVKVLVEECDANVDVRDGEDKTPLHAARETLAFRRRTHSVMSTSFIEENLELARVIEYLESINQSDSGEMARRIR